MSTVTNSVLPSGDDALYSGRPPRAAVCFAGDRRELKAYYRLIGKQRAQMSPEGILSGYHRQSIRRIKGYGRVLAIQETTDLDFSDRLHRNDLGDIGKNRTGTVSRGLKMHSALALSEGACPRAYWAPTSMPRILKSGCRIEAHQHQNAVKLARAIPIDAVMAWRVMLLTLLGREALDLRCELIFDPWDVPPARRTPSLGGARNDPGAEKVALRIATANVILSRLGGALNRNLVYCGQVQSEEVGACHRVRSMFPWNVPAECGTISPSRGEI